jgi:hypothetical protein
VDQQDGLSVLHVAVRVRSSLYTHGGAFGRFDAEALSFQVQPLA